MLVRVGDLEEISEDAIVAYLERADSGPGALVRLNRRDRILAAITQRTQGIQFDITARRNRIFLADHQRRTLDQHRGEAVGAVATVIPILQHRRQLSTAGVPLRRMREHLTHRVGHLRKPRQRITKRAQLTWRGAAGGRFAGQALHVTHTIKRVPYPRTTHRIAHEHGDGIEPQFDRRALQQRRQQPLPQHSLPHRCHGAVKHRQQRAGEFATTQRFNKLEVAARHFIERHDATGTLYHGTGKMWQTAGLQLAQIA